MPTTELQEVLRRNWEAWARGGISELEICSIAKTETIKEIRNEFENHATPQPIDTLSNKTIIDITTWLTHGTHELPYLPPDIRGIRIEEASRRFGVAFDVLHSIYAASNS